MAVGMAAPVAIPVRLLTDFRDCAEAGAAAMSSAAIRRQARPGNTGGMLRLYQAEWCPYSSKVRQKLTELGMPFVALQVEPEPDDRDEMRTVTGSDVIPVAVLSDGTVLDGDADEIVAELGRRYVSDASRGGSSRP
jgi:glutaredoxin